MKAQLASSSNAFAFSRSTPSSSAWCDSSSSQRAYRPARAFVSAAARFGAIPFFLSSRDLAGVDSFADCGRQRSRKKCGELCRHRACVLTANKLCESVFMLGVQSANEPRKICLDEPGVALPKIVQQRERGSTVVLANTQPCATDVGQRTAMSFGVNLAHSIVILSLVEIYESEPRVSTGKMR